jgi:protein arginine N-methyltransferase 1
MKLDPHLLLRRIPELKIELDSSNCIQIFANGIVVKCGAHGLALLDLFYRPTTMAQAAEQLTSGGAQDWIEVTGEIVKLYQAGVLQGEDADPTLLSTTGYDSAPMQVAMLNDRVRTQRYLDAIREVVQPGDVVLDIGTGTGVLSIAAAKAGARQVYAIEASGISSTARAMFAANGVADRVTVIEGWSTQVSLPERADVLVSEVIGDEPFGEQILEITNDALRRLLKPGARLVPGRMRVFGLPVTIPDAFLVKYGLSSSVLPLWRDWYDIDFSVFIESSQRVEHYFTLRPQQARTWQTLGDPVLLADVDLAQIAHLVIDTTVSAAMSQAGLLNGVLIYFEIDLSPSVTLSTHPALADDQNHWYSFIWTLPQPLSVTVGDRLDFTYQYNLPGIKYRVAVGQSPMSG